MQLVESENALEPEIVPPLNVTAGPPFFAAVLVSFAVLLFCLPTLVLPKFSAAGLMATFVLPDRLLDKGGHEISYVDRAPSGSQVVASAALNPVTCESCCAPQSRQRIRPDSVQRPRFGRLAG